jgi:ketosteroid isomerase-like protein
MTASGTVDKAMDAFRGVARTFWGPLKKIVTFSRGRSMEVEKRITRLEDEQAVRDAHISYVNAYDSGDIDGIMVLFSEDALLINSRGSFVGKPLIRQSYEWVNARRVVSFHNVTSTLVRFDPEDGSAWLTAYYQVPSKRPSGEIHFNFGTYALRLVKEGGEWRIAQMRITGDLHTSLQPVPSSSTGDGPPPTFEQSSRNLPMNEAAR